jgi:glutamyl/glutaminyl-tRNA synthetase
LLFEGNKKLSKRSGNGTTEDYKDFSKAAMLNWLLKFGWSHPDPTFDKKYPTLSMDQMIEL